MKMKRLILLFYITILLFFNISLEAHAADKRPFFDVLTPDEILYIEESDIIPTIVSPNKGPIQYIDAEGKQRGITIDVLELISSFSGLRFEYISMNGLQNIQNSINDGHAEIVAGIPMEATLQDAYKVNFSKGYLSCLYGIILNRNNNLNNMGELVLALPTGLDIPEQFKTVRNIKRFDTIQKCIAAVENKEADFAYGNSYVLEFYSQGYKLQNLCVIPLVGTDQHICFGASQTADPRLNSILNKAIDYIGTNGQTNILIKNIAVSTQTITLATLISANPQISILTGILLLSAIILIAVLLIGNYRLKNHRIRLEHQRHMLVSNADNEYFYELNYKTDTMTFSKEISDLFGCNTVIHKWKRRSEEFTSAFYSAFTQADPQLTPSPNEASDNLKEKNIEIQLPLKDGTTHWFRISKVDIYESGRLAYIIGKVKDVQKEHIELNNLLEKSLCDSLTGIYNAEAIKKFINMALKKQNAGTFFIIDLDYFKHVNDCFGHQVGDAVIKNTAAILTGAFRKEDIIGRLGGDEFIVFVPEISEDEFISAKCKQLLALIKDIEFPESYCQTFSIGISKACGESTFEQMYHQADKALYQAKENGRNNFHIAQAD